MISTQKLIDLRKYIPETFDYPIYISILLDLKEEKDENNFRIFMEDPNISFGAKAFHLYLTRLPRKSFITFDEICEKLIISYEEIQGYIDELFGYRMIDLYIQAAESFWIIRG